MKYISSSIIALFLLTLLSFTPFVNADVAIQGEQCGYEGCFCYDCSLCPFYQTCEPCARWCIQVCRSIGWCPCPPQCWVACVAIEWITPGPG